VDDDYLQLESWLYALETTAMYEQVTTVTLEHLVMMERLW